MSWRETGLGPAARRRSQSCAECGESADPHRALSEEWEPRSGTRRTSPLQSRGAAGTGAPAAGPQDARRLRGRAAALGAFLPHIPAGVARNGRRRWGLWPRLCSRAAAEACAQSLALVFSEPLPDPAARSQSKERKKKRGGGGAADSSVLPSPPVGRQQRCYWRRGAARGRRGGAPRLSAGSGANGPASKLGRQPLHRGWRSGRSDPVGLHDLRERVMLVHLSLAL